MERLKKWFIITLVILLGATTFKVSDVKADENNGVISQIERLQNRLNDVASKVEISIKDILGIKDTLSGQGNEIVTLKDTIVNQQEEIGLLKAEINSMKSQSSNSGDLITIQLNSVSKECDPYYAYGHPEWAKPMPLMENRPIRIINMNDNSKIYNFKVDDSGKCEIKVPVGWYKVEIPYYSAPNNSTLKNTSFIIVPANAEDSKIEITQRGWIYFDVTTNLYKFLAEPKDEDFVFDGFN